MRHSEARVVLEAARRWNERGLFGPGAYEQVERELEQVRRAGEPSLAMQTFYAVGGLLLGAATGALFLLLETNGVLTGDETTAWTFFLVASLTLLAAGVVLALRHQDELGDSLLLAGLVPAAVLLGPRPPATEALWFLPILLGGAVLALRHRQGVVPVAALLLVLVAVPVTLFRSLEQWDVASFYWMLVATAMLAGAVVWNRVAAPSWRDVAAFATTLGVVGALLAFISQVLDPAFLGGVEVLLGAGLLALLGVGVWVRERAMLFAAGGALTVDAIFFAFDVGGVTWGLVTLLALSASLIVAATVLRRRPRAEPS